MTEDEQRVERVREAIYSAHTSVGYYTAGEIARTAIAAMEAEPERPEAVPTVRVKVAVVVSQTGKIFTCGEEDYNSACFDSARDAANTWCLDAGEMPVAEYTVEADVPLPAAPSVLRGQVTEKNKERAG